jgi:hypothetical protein
MDEHIALNRRLEKVEEALYTAGLLPRPVIAEEAAPPPLVPVTIIGTPFRGSPLHPHTVTAEFQCPACQKKSARTIYTKSRGINATACSCGQVVRVDLQW